MKKRIFKVIIIITIFCIGLTLGKLLNWGYFELSKEISIVDGLSLFLTIGLAIYITYVLEKEMQDKRLEKELYIAKIGELESLLEVISNLIEESNSSYAKINNKIQSCRVIKKAIFDNINSKFRFVSLKDLDDSISSNMNSLKRLLTETPLVSNHKTEISLSKGVVVYSLLRILEINTKIGLIKDCLFRLKVLINSA